MLLKNFNLIDIIFLIFIRKISINDTVKKNLDTVSESIKDIVKSCADDAWESVEREFYETEQRFKDGILLDLIPIIGGKGLPCIYIDNKGNRYGQDGGGWGWNPFKKEDKTKK